MVDEFKRNLTELKQLVQSGDYTRIGVYALPGEGKTFLLDALIRELGDTEWNVFTYEECTVDSIEAPYVLPYVDPNPPTFKDNPEKAPEVFFILKYSTAYKQSVSGVSEDLGPSATMRDYMKRAKQKADSLVFSGKRILHGPDALQRAYEEAHKML